MYALMACAAHLPPTSADDVHPLSLHCGASIFFLNTLLRPPCRGRRRSTALNPEERAGSTGATPARGSTRLRRLRFPLTIAIPGGVTLVTGDFGSVAVQVLHKLQN